MDLDWIDREIIIQQYSEIRRTTKAVVIAQDTKLQFFVCQNPSPSLCIRLTYLYDSINSDDTNIITYTKRKLLYTYKGKIIYTVIY